MTDHADIVREHDRAESYARVIDTLAERMELAEARAEAAEAEVARLREALASVENVGDIAAVRIARSALGEDA